MAPLPLGRRRTGSLCLLAGLCLLVLAVMPVAAQAEGKHWRQNGVLMAEGEETPVVMFGNQENLEQIGAEGLNCKGVGGGTIENPVGGGPGVGRTNSLNFYECKGRKCEEEVLKAFGVPGRVTFTFENNPATTKEPAFPGYNDVLEESTVGGVSSAREKSANPL